MDAVKYIGSQYIPRLGKKAKNKNTEGAKYVKQTKKDREELLRLLAGGAIPERLHFVRWVDITQMEGCDLAHEQTPIEFISIGIIIERNKKYIKLQQSYQIRDDNFVTDKSGNLLLLIPVGVIKEAYNFKLED
ncbi:hypothetical protein KKE60_05975 [Patescibacteria group bacterium]|nr:hypothetical protein [Patescibacteria group bacterium]